MANIIDQKRIDQIINFLNSLKINSERFNKLINSKDIFTIKNFHEALMHSSSKNLMNYEKLEFFGDAVLRLAATNFIDQKYANMCVGDRSKLRSEIVSDEWLSQIGKKIDIESMIIKGPEAIGDKNSGDTIIAEATEALIGAIYKCFNSIIEVNLWLDKFWEQDSEEFLKTPYKFNAKTSLQEWCQSKGIDLPVYKIIEITKNHGDPKRFFCEIYINGTKEGKAFGQSHKKAEKTAAGLVIDKFIKEGKI